MAKLMRCKYCGTLQDEPQGAKICVQCGGELKFEARPTGKQHGYIDAQMELDQVKVPGGRNTERYLLITLRAPQQIPKDEAASASNARTLINFGAALDISGSMRGNKIKQAKEALRQALQRLQDGDTFSMTTFGSDVRCITPPTPINDHTRRVVQSVLDEIQAGGMTALCGGLEMGIEKTLESKQESNLVLLLSDGQANVGETDIEKVGHRGFNARQQGITISTLGMGNNYNEALMAEIATQGGGRFYHVSQAKDIGSYLTGELGEISNLAARDLKIHLNLPDGATVMPLSSAYPAQQNKNQATITVGDVPCGTELEIPIRLTLAAQAAGEKVSITGSLSYNSPAKNAFTQDLNAVALRFLEAQSFEMHDGVVTPTVERVLNHMRAANVLGVSRTMSKDKRAGEQEAAKSSVSLHAYAQLLGEERAKEEQQEMDADFSALQSAPAVAKRAVASAHSRQRGTKKFKE